MSKKLQTDEASVSKNPKKKLIITETHRTIILIVLLVFAVGFIYWTSSSYDTNFVDGF